MARPSKEATEAVKMLKEHVDPRDLQSIVLLIGGGNIRQALFHFESQPEKYGNREKEIAQILRRLDTKLIDQLESLTNEINSHIENTLLEYIPLDQ